MHEVKPGVWRAGTRYVNWYVIDGGAAGLTVVDTGLPGYGAHLAPALRELGRAPTDVKAVLLTHGHVDHAGGAAVLERAGAEVLLHEDDRALAADPRRNRTQAPLWRYAWWPATAAFLAHALRNGALGGSGELTPSPLGEGELPRVPGAPVVHHVPGHTAGSCAFEFPDHDVVLVGDALCTSDPFTGRSAPPQLQTRGSNASSDQALASLDRLLGIGARVVLPGHGSPSYDGMEAAVASARRVGCR